MNALALAMAVPATLALAICQSDTKVSLPTARPEGSSQQDRALDAVYEYVRYSSPKLDDFERDIVAADRSVREILGWPFQDRLQHYRMFSYPNGNPQHGVYIVSVDENYLVTELDDIRDFNELLRKEGARLLTEQDASAAAQLFLKTYYSGGSLYHGYALGMNVINRVDDIKFSDPNERKRIATLFDITPPALKHQGTTYAYTLWAWQKDGNGMLQRVTVTLDEKGVLDLKTEALKGMVGDWVGLR